MYCKKCGTELIKDSLFCMGCGEKIDMNSKMTSSIFKKKWIFVIFFLVIVVLIGIFQIFDYDKNKSSKTAEEVYYDNVLTFFNAVMSGVGNITENLLEADYENTPMFAEDQEKVTAAFESLQNPPQSMLNMYQVVIDMNDTYSSLAYNGIIHLNMNIYELDFSRFKLLHQQLVSMIEEFE